MRCVVRSSMTMDHVADAGAGKRPIASTALRTAVRTDRAIVVFPGT
jgi:hypothetical protein